MIRRSKDLKKLTDDEFDSIVGPFDDKITNYITNEIVNEFVAYYISTAFEMDAIWDEDFKLSFYAAVDTLAQLDSDSYDLDKIKSTVKDIWEGQSIKADIRTLKVEPNGAEIIE